MAEETETEDPKETDKIDHSHEDKSTDDGKDIRAIVREEVEKALKGLKPGEKKESPEGKQEGGFLRGRERWAEELVRQEAEKIEAEKEHQKQHEVLKKVAEAPPKMYRKITELMWGKDEKAK